MVYYFGIAEYLMGREKQKSVVIMPAAPNKD